MKNLFSPKNLLTKNLLTKSLPKILLLVLLAFGGCDMIRYGFNQTLDIPSGGTGGATPEGNSEPSAELVRLLGGVTCLQLYDEEGGIATRLYKFLEDATTICLNNETDLEYIEGGNDYAYYAYTYTDSNGSILTKDLWLKKLVLKNGTLTGDFTLIITHIIYPFLNSDVEGSFTYTKQDI